MRYQIFSSNEWLYPDSEITENGCKTISLATARGAYIGCQILFKSIPKNATITWDFKSNSSEHWLRDPEIYQLIDVLVNENAGVDSFTIPVGTVAEYVTRQAPFYVYDAMKPVGREYVAGSETEAMYVCWKIPTTVVPSIYKGKLEFSVGNDKCSIPVNIEVFPASVPEKGMLSITNWFSLENIANRHNIEMWSEDFWEMLRKYGEAMRRGRQTHFMVPMNVTRIYKLEDNKYEFDFSNTERMIRLFFELGFSCIEGGHVARRNGWEDPTFVLVYDNTVEATKHEGYVFLSQYLTAWFNFLKKNNWLDKVIQHVADEPIENCASDYRILSGIVRKFMPGVPLIDAVIYPQIQGAVDIWVPTNKGYDDYREQYEKFRELGDILWFYTCCNPCGFYLNRFLDFPLLRTRFLHWGNYKYDMKGYLHWGFNQYLRDQDPFKLTCPKLCPEVHDKRVPAGDTHIVYPGDNGPWLSMRLEAMRAGAEDYELLKILSKYNRALADEIVESCMKSFKDVNIDIHNFNTNYRRLLEAVSSYTG